MGAQSFVAYSFEDEFSTLNANINGTHHMLAAVRDVVPHCRFYFAASSEMFGKVEEVPQNERTPRISGHGDAGTTCTLYRDRLRGLVPPVDAATVANGLIDPFTGNGWIESSMY